MNVKSVLSLALACATGLLATSAVQASTVGSSATTITSITYQLVDYDLSDGITPWVQFAPSNSGYLYLADDPGSDHVTEFELQIDDAGPLGSQSGSLVSPDGAVKALITPTGLSTSITADSSALLNNVYNSYSSYDQHVVTGVAYAAYGTGPVDAVQGPIGGFIISPNTGIVFEVEYSVETVADLGALKESFAASGLDIVDFSVFAPFDVGVRVYRFGDDIPDYEVYDEIYGEDINFLDLSSFGSDISTQTLLTGGSVSMGFVNDSASEAEALFGFEAITQIEVRATSTIAAAIPEPSTYALMLLGLGGLAAAVRRQQRRATTH